MNKHIVNVLKDYNFTYDRNYGYGSISGYEVNVVELIGRAGPTFFISTYLSQEKKAEFVLKVKELKIKLVQAFIFDLGVAVEIGALTAMSFKKKYSETMPKILDLLNELEAPKKDICPQTGVLLDETESRVVNVDNLKFRLSTSAIDTINNSIDKGNEEFKNKPNNYLRGFIGIVIGAIVGSVLSVVLWFIGLVTTIIPFVSILLGTFLYQKFGGKKNWMMIVMSFVTTLVFIISTLVIIYGLAAVGITYDAGKNMQLFDAFKYCLANNPEFKSEFYRNFLLNIFFILLAEGIAVFSLIRSIKRPKNV